MAEKEYIERKALIKYAEKQEVIIKDGLSIADAMRIQGNVFRRCLETCPAADVAPVRHGYWEQGDIYDIGDVCSLCQYDSNREPCTYKYCPHCGAKMDGDKNE